MNIDEIAKLYGNPIETIDENGEWIEEAPSAPSIDEIAEANGTAVETFENGEWITVPATSTTKVESTFAAEINEEITKVTPAGPAKIISSLRVFGWTVSAIAYRVGVSTSTIYRWSRVENWPLDENYSRLLQLARSV